MTEQTRPSADLRADLAHLDTDRGAAADRLAELEAGRNAVLLTDDDAKAEAHDAEMQRVRRAIERADLKRPGIVAAIEAAVAREEADAYARRQAEASAAVEAVIARLAKEYEAPAKIIAAFLADWQRAAELAEAAKVPGPDALVRERPPQMIAPAGEDVFLVYIDEQGRDTDQPYPPGAYTPGMPTRRQQRRTRERPARYDTGIYLGALAGRANLPAARVGEAAPWEGADLALKSDLPQPHTRRFL
ncbi:hypothetical protein ASG32_31365 [Methylobacterium sp. Leaf361]|nr:hypothetical protein ASG32_31365 [Methylobacterium sp. Leaf361]